MDREFPTMTKLTTKTREVEPKSLVDTVIVRYKEYLPSGEMIISKSSYKSWSEDGNYTVFYDGSSRDSAVFLIPTRLICSIELLRD